MSLLISAEALSVRRLAADGPLAPLAGSLRRDLQGVLDKGFRIPSEKALLSRDGGRCPHHGVPLEFDPYQPRQHRCPACGEIFTGERHYLAWVMWYQLWLAERSVHAAALHAVTGDDELAGLARRILAGYAESYLRYPNLDNVLGPSRPFFSTYLESIWLLQICVALDLLEMAGAAGTLGGTVRDRIILPSVSVIMSFDEGASNRQVWNDAALLAAALMLEDAPLARRAIAGPSGILSHMTSGLLVDGSWYEGENYHFFAHRGLWYGVTMAEQAGEEIPAALRERFLEGFAAPLATALPDFTFPSRRDSQYAMSLRQWRFAESCELGLARADDPRLSGALHSLYAPDAAPRRDTGRWRSTAEAERNEPAAALSRADLGWRSLLLARETLSAVPPEPPRSALLVGQGIAVLRRDAGNAYLALDYGHSGGGHGHPDRLNVLLVHGSDRWLDDMGTGSYVDSSLHWYRSTLAHNAPLVNGRSQRRASGVLRAFDEGAEAGWVDAELPAGSVAPGVRLRRSLVAMRDYAVDRIEWESDGAIRFELPLHLAAKLQASGTWTTATLDGSLASEDGFSFAHDAAFTRVAADEVVLLRREGGSTAWAVANAPSEWWRARAPGAPGTSECDFLILRMDGERGIAHLVWNWGSAIEKVLPTADGVSVQLVDGSRHDHAPRGDGWGVDVVSDGLHRAITLGGVRPTEPVGARSATGRLSDSTMPGAERDGGASNRGHVSIGSGRPLTFELGSSAYRISEESWEEAGRPAATVELHTFHGALVIDLDVKKSPVVFRSPVADDPRLDNENPDIHSDGVQLYLDAPEGRGLAAWLVVPELGGTVRVHALGDGEANVPLDACWHSTPAGYAMRFALPLVAIGVRRGSALGVQLVVNDMAPGRTRRRGQLVLTGGRGDHIYLRGDREHPSRFMRLVIDDV